MVRTHLHIGVAVVFAITTALAAVNVSARSITGKSDAPDLTIQIVKTPTDGGIREDIPAKYRARFDKWKSELLETEFGREQWNKYANNLSFILTIVVSGNR